MKIYLYSKRMLEHFFIRLSIFFKKSNENVNYVFRVRDQMK